MRNTLTGLACALAFAGAVGQTAYADTPQRNSICIRVHDIDSMSYPDNHTIIFHMWAGPVKVWQNTLARDCPGLKFEKGIAWNIWGDQVCSNMQIFYVLRQGNPCSLGNFTALERRGQPPAH